MAVILIRKHTDDKRDPALRNVVPDAFGKGDSALRVMSSVEYKYRIHAKELKSCRPSYIFKTLTYGLAAYAKSLFLKSLYGLKGNGGVI